MDETDILDVDDLRQRVQRRLTLLAPSTRIRKTYVALAPELSGS